MNHEPLEHKKKKSALRKREREIVNLKREALKKPAKFKPAFLQATAVIIICEPSSEWTKFGGNAVLCRLTMICNISYVQNQNH